MTTPPEPEHLTLELSTATLHALAGGSGTPLLLLHHDVGPFGWTPFHAELARHFRVVAPDFPGFGGSPRADWMRHPRDLAATMLAAARKLGFDRYVLAGLGYGGWVAAEMASFAPGPISAMILAAPAGIRPDESFILDQVMMDYRDYVRAGFSSDAAYEKYVPNPPSKEQRESWDASREVIARICWKPYMYSYELPVTLGDVHVPSTIVWGRDDRVIPPECARLYADALPHASVQLISGGHFLDLEQPDALAEIIVTAAGRG